MSNYSAIPYQVQHTFPMELRRVVLSSLKLLYVFLIYMAPGGASHCPSDAMMQARRCTDNLGLGQLKSGSPKEFIQEGDGGKALKACSNGDFLDAISCMERVLDRCKYDNSDSAHFLRQMVDVESARKSITFFCTNVRTFVNNADCVKAHHQEQLECGEDAMRDYITQVRATNNMDSRMRFQCTLNTKLLKCTELVLTKRCGESIALILKTVMEGFVPPTCRSLPRSKDEEVESSETQASYDVDFADKEGLVSSNNGEENGGKNFSRCLVADLLLSLTYFFLTMFA